MRGSPTATVLESDEGDGWAANPEDRSAADHKNATIDHPVIPVMWGLNP